MHVQLNAMTTPLIAKNQHGGYKAYLSPEEYMIYASRVSSPDNRENHKTAPKLLKYLIKHGHWSPFEMISFGFEIETSRAIAQQLLRHRSFSFQEFSQRYAEVTELEPVQLREAGSTNRQSSVDPIGDQILIDRVGMHLTKSMQLYGDLLDNNIAKETARMVLPLTTQTTIIMHGTLRSWIHFFDQRCSPHAQKEVRLIAERVRALLGEQCPWTSAALNWNGEQNTPKGKRERLRELLINTVEKVI